RRSGVTRTPVTVTNPSRGSLSFWISCARISRSSSATRSSLLPSVIGVVKGHLAVDEFQPRPGGDVPLHLLQHLADVVSLAGHRGHSDRGPLPQVVVVDLGHRDVELVADAGGQALHHVALLLERAASGDA